MTAPEQLSFPEISQSRHTHSFTVSFFACSSYPFIPPWYQIDRSSSDSSVFVSCHFLHSDLTDLVSSLEPKFSNVAVCRDHCFSVCAEVSPKLTTIGFLKSSIKAFFQPALFDFNSFPARQSQQASAKLEEETLLHKVMRMSLCSQGVMVLIPLGTLCACVPFSFENCLGSCTLL